MQEVQQLIDHWRAGMIRIDAQPNEHLAQGHNVRMTLASNELFGKKEYVDWEHKWQVFCGYCAFVDPHIKNVFRQVNAARDKDKALKITPRTTFWYIQMVTPSVVQAFANYDNRVNDR